MNDDTRLDLEDMELAAEQRRLSFLSAMERGRESHRQAVISAALGWYDNMTSVRHASALQEAVLRIRYYDRDYLRKYVKKFDIPDTDTLHIYLLELEAKLG